MPSLKVAQEWPARTALKEERARDAARAMNEYAAEEVAVRAKAARLRALRLASEASAPKPATAKAPR